MRSSQLPSTNIQSEPAYYCDHCNVMGDEKREQMAVPPNNLGNSTNNASGKNNADNMNITSPVYYQSLDQGIRGDNDLPQDPLATSTATTTGNHLHNDCDNSKSCRICLEDDNPETMIAPCKCRGWSKWVHRDCLDEWRLNERDRAFSRCTECLFEYYMQPIYKDHNNNSVNHRRLKFYWNVSRDVCLGTILLQIIIMVLGAAIFACDRNQALPNQVMPAFQTHPASLYYLLGWLSLLILVGIYGSGVLCLNGCSISESFPAVVHPLSSASDGIQVGKAQNSDATPVIPTNRAIPEDRLPRGLGMESTTEFYRRARHRRQRNNVRHDQSVSHDHRNHDIWCDSCVYCCNRQPIILYDPGFHGCCCCCDHCRSSAHSCQDSDCRCCEMDRDCCGGENSNQDCGDCAHVLLIMLLFFAVILAVIGFFVGIVITVVAFQRVVQRHIYLLQKRQLIEEYQVVDLQDYDLNRPLPTAPREEDLEWNTELMSSCGVAPSSPLEPLPTNDVAFLKRLGLMD